MTRYFHEGTVPPVTHKWQDQAACREADPDLFFSTVTGTTRLEWTKKGKRALAICARCPVTRECLRFALEHKMDDPTDGIWGGTVPEWRRYARADGLSGQRLINTLLVTGAEFARKSGVAA